MGDLSTNFSRDEFACNCGCGLDTVDAKTLIVLQHIRTETGRAVVINSGCRCPSYNRKVGGAKNSQHLYGRASDFSVAGHSPSWVADWVERNYPEMSIGRYRSFTHIDSRTAGKKGARW